MFIRHTLATLGWLALSAAGTQAAPPSVLAPVAARVKAVVRQAQPRTSFGSYRDILIGQYRTTNYLIHQPGAEGRKLPPYQELGPMPGGFYLQLAVGRSGGDTAVRTTQPTNEKPWTTVTSFYPLSRGRTIVMTWEAAPGAPRGVAARVSRVLSSYAAGLK